MNSTRLVAILILSLTLSTGNIRTSISPSGGFEASNVGIPNLQVTAPINGTAMDLHTNQCVHNAEFTANVGSTLIVDPSDLDHLVGSTQFIFDVTNNFFSGSAAEIDSNDGGVTWGQHLVTGFDCSQPSFSDSVGTYGPSIAIDRSGNLYAAVLPVFRGHFPLYVVKSIDGGSTWGIANDGKPVFEPQPNEVSSKGWIAIDNFQNSAHYGMVYLVWIAFLIGTKLVGSIMISKSTDEGESFSQPIRISPITSVNVSFVNPILAIGPDGTLYVSDASMAVLPSVESNVPDFGQREEYVVKSTDGGLTFTPPIEVTSTMNHGYDNAPFRTSQFQSFAVNPRNGHLLLAVEQVTRANYEVTNGNYTEALAERTDIAVYESTNSGQAWTVPLTVNDDPPSQNEDAFQPVIATSPNGLVGIAFYDSRLLCPSEPWVLADDVGKEDFCIDTAIQFYNDTDSLTPIGNNIRVTKYSWDPMNPGKIGRASGLSDVWFIGDHFGLAMTNMTAYPLFAANFNLGTNPDYNMQLFVAPVNISASVASNSTTTMQSQTNISQEQTTIEAGNESLQLIAGVCLVVFVAIVLIALKRRRILS
ncbi:MAG TPA: sialidase family protein [Candidatus Bathyarchaeia archaeon]|nr:sialidase family protein [Candidatus Bathyarchaeia archaeon]